MKTIVLVLIGTELILFTAASMGLCFVFVLEMLLIVQRCFHYCREALKQSQGPHPTSEEAGWVQGAGNGHSCDSGLQLIQEMSHIIWHQAQHIK